MENEQAKKFIIDLLRHASSKKASDIFVTVDFPPAIKIDGKLQQVSSQPLSSDQVGVLVRSIMNQHQENIYDNTLECNFAISPEGIGRYRVSAYYERGHCGMVIRKVNTEIKSFEALHLPEILKTISMYRSGVVIFSGGTGSGKTTSLATMIDWRNEHSFEHIITIEDPIEYVHQHKKCIVTQREIGVDTESWESALKNTLRQAPNVVLMGEIRDKESMISALQFAETGHLCLCSLHATNANQTMERILNFFPKDHHQKILMDLSMNLKAVVSQRLLTRVDGKGRVPAVEVMLNNAVIADLIFKEEIHSIKEIMSRSTEIGMQTFDQALFDLFENELICYEEAMRNADSSNDLRLRIKLESKSSKDKDLMSGLGDLDIVS